MRRKKALSIIANDRSTRMIDPKANRKGLTFASRSMAFFRACARPLLAQKVAKNNLID
jgi:hypothetical protein